MDNADSEIVPAIKKKRRSIRKSTIKHQYRGKERQILDQTMKCLYKVGKRIPTNFFYLMKTFCSVNSMLNKNLFALLIMADGGYDIKYHGAMFHKSTKSHICRNLPSSSIASI